MTQILLIALLLIIHSVVTYRVGFNNGFLKCLELLDGFIADEMESEQNAENR